MSNKTPKRRSNSDSWSDFDEKLLHFSYPKVSNYIISERLNRSVAAIRAKAVTMGLVKENRRWSEKDEKFVLSNWEALSPVEIGKHLGRTKWAVINKFRELNGLRR